MIKACVIGFITGQRKIKSFQNCPKQSNGIIWSNKVQTLSTKPYKCVWHYQVSWSSFSSPTRPPPTKWAMIPKLKMYRFCF